MEVTPANFVNLFPRIMDAYARCSFISIDCEMSGTRLEDDKPGDKAEPRSADASPAASGGGPQKGIADRALSLKLRERAYAKLRTTAQKYTVLQVGMTFGWTGEGNDVSLSSTPSRGVPLRSQACPY
jgi:hypothetical protein